MNERILELAKQATRKAMWPGDPDAGELDVEKFAELIVQKATDIVYDMLDDNTGAEVVVAVKEHFGVE